ncbi:helix-turn-helix domain-containing protein [Microbacterium lushaniae]|uniref:helix-turn-helix domain-containing protein n=1 Tax=Microbacterium lushaniae TaxID=2614639 RepID=UPI00177B73CD|nr:helix-turn-helix domain-containing protein [Microbacterium lushaniae]
MEGELLAALADSAEPDPLVDWMWDRIRRSGGRARIGDLVARTGWSHRHVTSRFARRFGVSPKAAAGVVRFERAAAEVGRVPLPDLAVRHGYADQSHLTREMLRYAGEPPGRLAAGGHPTAYTALGTKPR